MPRADRRKIAQKEALAEAEARLTIGQIARVARLREELAAPWWEMAMKLALYPVTLGLLLSLVRLARVDELLPTSGLNIALRLAFIWTALLVFLLVAVLESQNRRMRAIARMLDVVIHSQDEIEHRLWKLEDRLPPAPPASTSADR